jgi:hypothetical protein
MPQIEARLGGVGFHKGIRMNVASTFRMLAGGLSAGLLIGAFGAGSAEAKPVKPGGVTGLTASVTPVQPGSTSTSYAVSATWGAASGATKYRVALTKGGVTLSSGNVTTTAWTPTVTSTPGTASLSVTPVATHRKGTTVSVPVNLPDVVAPEGSYTSSWVGVNATITEVSLSDDSPVAGVSRVVSWGDASSPQAWPSDTTLDHTYPGVGRYLPTVTLTDGASNVRVVDVPAVVVGDTTAPTGAFATAPGKAWAAFTPVTVSQSALNDDFTPADMITRSVDWGDGSAPTAWTSGTTTQHVYVTAGSFVPTVTITDEAGNHLDVVTSAVTVKTDSAAPVLKLLLPSAVHSVKAWKTLRGTATDAPGTGVKRVSLRAVEKRGAAWFGYRPATKTWVKAATKARAFQKGRAFTLTTNAQNRWTATLAGLRKGALVYKVLATDQVANASATLTHKASLTKP